MKRKIGRIFFSMIFVIGICIVLYPSVSNWVNQRNASKVVANYHEVAQELSNQENRHIKDKAIKHNQKIARCTFLSKALSMEKEDHLKSYEANLNIACDGVMGVLRIPSIHVILPIYHTTKESVIQKAVGHYVGSSLPIGGKSTHCILSGHRGLRSARLFTDLDQLKIKDQFYVDILQETHAYQIDDIKIVKPNDVDNLHVIDGKDYITLVTCTPYGVNTHRLLVRGKRIPYQEVIDEDKTIVSPQTKRDHRMMIMWSCIVMSGVLVVIKRRKKHE